MNELKCLDMVYTDRKGMVAKCQTFTQIVECLSPPSSPLVKDVSIISSPVWWSEVVPESRWCFVWSQTGHDQTGLPWSSWRANLLCGSRVKEQGERLSSVAGWTAGGGGRAAGRKPPVLLGVRAAWTHKKDKGPDTAAPNTTCLLHPLHTLLLLVTHSDYLLRLHAFIHKITHT